MDQLYFITPTSTHILGKQLHAEKLSPSTNAFIEHLCKDPSSSTAPLTTDDEDFTQLRKENKTVPSWSYKEAFQVDTSEWKVTKAIPYFRVVKEKNTSWSATFNFDQPFVEKVHLYGYLVYCTRSYVSSVVSKNEAKPKPNYMDELKNKLSDLTIEDSLFEEMKKKPIDLISYSDLRKAIEARRMDIAGWILTLYPLIDLVKSKEEAPFDPLFLCVLTDQLEMFQLILTQSVLGSVDSAFELAITDNKKEFVKWILQYRVSLDDHPLLTAAKFGDAEMMRLVWRLAPAMETTYDQMCFQGLIVTLRKLDLWRVAIEQGMSPIPLMEEAISKQWWEAVTILLDETTILFPASLVGLTVRALTPRNIFTRLAERCDSPTLLARTLISNHRCDLLKIVLEKCLINEDLLGTACFNGRLDAVILITESLTPHQNIAKGLESCLYWSVLPTDIIDYLIDNREDCSPQFALQFFVDNGRVDGVRHVLKTFYGAVDPEVALNEMMLYFEQGSTKHSCILNWYVSEMKMLKEGKL
jgi:hypothetical protein